jgi:hypothetical protein
MKIFIPTPTDLNYTIISMRFHTGTVVQIASVSIQTISSWVAKEATSATFGIISSSTVLPLFLSGANFVPHKFTHFVLN